ncbi:MAG: hypothetical protein FWH32_05505 [Clostridiales bacterium]|nr:hypothetical protein [Clostridiales bacterium]
MDANTIVALFLTILMVGLCGIALAGGEMIDKKRRNEARSGQQAAAADSE